MSLCSLHISPIRFVLDRYNKKDDRKNETIRTLLQDIYARYIVDKPKWKGGIPVQDEQIVELYWQRDERGIPSSGGITTWIR